MALGLISIKAKSDVEVSMRVLFVAHRSLDVTSCYINHLGYQLVHEKPTRNTLFPHDISKS